MIPDTPEPTRPHRKRPRVPLCRGDVNNRTRRNHRVNGLLHNSAAITESRHADVSSIVRKRTFVIPVQTPEHWRGERAHKHGSAMPVDDPRCVDSNGSIGDEENSSMTGAKSAEFKQAESTGTHEGARCDSENPWESRARRLADGRDVRRRTGHDASREARGMTHRRNTTAAAAAGVRDRDLDCSTGCARQATRTVRPSTRASRVRRVAAELNLHQRSPSPLSETSPVIVDLLFSDGEAVASDGRAISVRNRRPVSGAGDDRHASGSRSLSLSVSGCHSQQPAMDACRQTTEARTVSVDKAPSNTGIANSVDVAAQPGDADVPTAGCADVTPVPADMQHRNIDAQPSSTAVQCGAVVVEPLRADEQPMGIAVQSTITDVQSNHPDLEPSGIESERQERDIIAGPQIRTALQPNDASIQATSVAVQPSSIAIPSSTGVGQPNSAAQSSSVEVLHVSHSVAPKAARKSSKQHRKEETRRARGIASCINDHTFVDDEGIICLDTPHRMPQSPEVIACDPEHSAWLRDKAQSRRRISSRGSHVQQIQTDEEVARRLQEALDAEMANDLASEEALGMLQEQQQDLQHESIASHMHQSHAFGIPPVELGAPYLDILPGFDSYETAAGLASQPARRGRRGRRRQQRGGVSSRTQLNDSWSTGNSYEELWQLSEQLGDAVHRGLSLREIEQLPTHAYTEPPGGATAVAASDCSICMERYRGGEQLRRLPCLHCFHATCIDTWLECQATCPVCRVKVDLHQQH
ncbi:PREDICTED: uncharacterized protein LOC106805905 isoform X2 [Priapulus caudatus]|nr:PREDICTED: uncharacterized protein LOC106805905 isoform X2 [Priapulus caudatus]XP_014663162.1 PREDICTED: uncharacterized protein LOC106805905 isoform X2 [Priapulus caudatus]